MKFNIVVSLNNHNLIGENDDLLIRSKKDLKRFAEITTNDKVKNIGRTKLNQGGGVLKAAPNKGAASLPKGVRNSMGFMKKGGKVKGYEHGGSVKGKKMNKCRMDGIAIRGKTRAKERSK